MCADNSQFNLRSRLYVTAAMMGWMMIYVWLTSCPLIFGPFAQSKENRVSFVLDDSFARIRYWYKNYGKCSFVLEYHHQQQQSIKQSNSQSINKTFLPELNYYFLKMNPVADPGFSARGPNSVRHSIVGGNSWTCIFKCTITFRSVPLFWPQMSLARLLYRQDEWRA